VRTVDGTWLRAGVLGLLLATATVLALTLDLPRVEVVRGWVDDAGGAAWAAMLLGLGVVLLAPVPRSAVSVLAGAVLGFWPGLALAVGGGVLAGLAAFGLGRALGRTAAVRLAGPRLDRADRLLSDRGFGAVLAGRLLPVVPFVVVSYGAGLTSVRFAPYALATAIGLLPGSVVQVGVGASAGALVDRAGPLPVAGALLAVLVVALGGLLGWRRRRTPSAAPA
jgi:uncharacterized membrane protein YdjX (TVP38/TMEM64 family)